MRELLVEISNYIISGNYKTIGDKVYLALDSNLTAKEILEGGLMKGMEVVGERFKIGEIFLPEVLMSARAFKSAMSLLEPIFLAAESLKQSRGKILLGTVKNDVHDIGKNLVGIMLKGNGFDVVDIGVDVSIEKFIENIEKENPDIIGLSAMLTTTMLWMKKTVESIREYFPDKLIIIGGAPVNQKFADEIHASGFGKDAIDAVTLCKRLLNIGNNTNL